MAAAISPLIPPTIQELIIVAAPLHDTLIRSLSETEYATSALRESRAHVSTLTLRVTEQQSLVSTLEARRLKEKVVHQRYRDSTIRRLIYSVSGKKDNFIDKISREEHRYQEAVDDYDDATRRLADLETQLAEAKGKHRGIEDAEVKHRSALQTLNELYDSIFSGPTPALPEEDRAELAVAEAGHVLEQQRTDLQNEKQALEILKVVGPVLNKLEASISEGVSASAMVMGGYRGLRDRDYLTRQAFYKQNLAMVTARATLEEFGKLIQQAQAISSNVEDIAPLAIPKPSYRGGQNSFTEQTQYHHTLLQNMKQVSNEAEKWRQGLRKSICRIKKMGVEVERLQKVLNDKRETLQNVRREVFDSVTGGLPRY